MEPDQDLFGNLLVKNLYFYDKYNAILKTGLEGLNITAGDDASTSNIFLDGDKSVSINSTEVRDIKNRPDYWLETSPLKANLNVDGLTFTDYLWVENDFRTSKLFVDTDLHVANDATIGNNLSVGNKVDAKEVEICCKLYVGHDDADSSDPTIITFGNKDKKEAVLTVNGETHLDNTNVEGSLHVSGISNTDPVLSVSSSKVAQVALHVTKGKTNLNGALTVAGNTDVTGTFNVTGKSTLDDTRIDGPLDVNGQSDLQKTNIVGELDVKGDTFLDKTTIDGDLNVNEGNVNIQKDLEVDGVTNLDNTNIEGKLDVTGQTDLEQTNIVGNLDVTGETDLDNTNIEGVLNVGSDDGHRSVLYSTHEIELEEKLSVFGDAAVHGTLYADDIITKEQKTVLPYSKRDELPKKAIPGQMYFSRTSIYIYTPKSGATFDPLNPVVTEHGQWERASIGEVAIEEE